MFVIERVVIVGTGLIGASVGLALREAGFQGSIVGIDASGSELEAAQTIGAVDAVALNPDAHAVALREADAVVLAAPVLAILGWLERVVPLVKAGALVTDVGSTKVEISKAGERWLPGRFLPGDPMAGKESGGAALAEASLFKGASWLFTPLHDATPIELEWREWVAKFGAKVLDLDAEKHDVMCAWVSHLPQYLATALSALLEDAIGDEPELKAIGGRALREMTRLGSSPYSMWRDVAMTNTKAVADTLLALEQRLQHLRENLKTPELREEFARANQFRSR